MNWELKLSPDVALEIVDHGDVVFREPRPERGFTRVFQSFASGHPEFQFREQNLKDPDTLKFNHRLHLGDSVRTKTGGKLDCASCHKADSFGEFHQKISFENNCRECHSLQFDKHNPDLQLPHGNPEAVRAFLRSLEIQYADLARRKGLTEQNALKGFVLEQMQNLRQEFSSGEELERQVFLSDQTKSPEGRPLYPGCAFCHEVSPRGEMAPSITKPQIPDRWFAHGNFNHGKHLQVACLACHDASKSEKTEDILLPGKLNCAACHSPRGGVRNDCATCHEFHSTEHVKLAEK